MPASTWWCVVRRVGRLCAGLALVAAPAFAQSQILTNGESILTWRPDSAQGAVVEFLGDAQDAHAVAFAPAGLWRLEFRKGASCITVTPSQLATYDLKLESDGSKLTVEWDDATTALLPKEHFTVEVEFEPGAEGVFDAKIAVTTKTPTSALYRVRFPILEVMPSGAAATTVLSAPFAQGVLLPDPVHNVTLLGASKINAVLSPCAALTQVEPGLVSMQWWSLYNSADSNSPVFFFGTQDPDGYRKEWAFDPIAVGPGLDRLRVILRHVPENNLALNGDYHQPYPFVMRVLRGDWYDAARYYRNWALEQPFTAQGPMAENPEFSDIIRDTDMLGVTQPPAGPDDPATPCASDPAFFEFANFPGEQASQRATFGVDEITPRIFFWDFNSFGRDPGDWFPIQPAFVSAANAATAQGDDYSAYFFSLAYSTRIASYNASYVPGYGAIETFGLINENLARSFVIGSACPTPPTNVQFLELCQATQFAGDYSAHVARRLFDEASCRGLYLDVIAGTEVRLCYDPTHGHPVGGGFYYTQGIKDLFERVREEMRNDPTAPVPEYFMQSEGPSEHFLPWLETVHPHLTWTRTQTFCDLFTGQCPRNGTNFLVAPLFQTVYHDFQTTSATLQLNAPRTLLGSLGIPLLQDPFFMRVLRNIFAAHVSLGFTPFAGAILSANLTAANAASPLFPDYTRLTGMVAQFMSILELDSVRAFTTFGARLRDPVLTKASAPGTPLTSVPFDTNPLAHNWLPYGRRQPLVYAAAYDQGGSGATGKELGILLMNWSDSSDNLFFGTADAGNQSVQLEFDPTEVMPTATSYQMFQVTSAGDAPFASGAVAGPITATVSVPARTAMFFRVVLN